MNARSESIRLSWRDNSGNESGYKIERSNFGEIGMSGEGSFAMMARAMGRELQAYGVPGTLDDPSFNVFGMDGGLPIAGNDDWTLKRESLSDLAAYVGAFPFEDGSKSAAQALWLNPGLYTAIATGNGLGSGEMLLEMYAIPTDSATQ